MLIRLCECAGRSAPLLFAYMAKMGFQDMARFKMPIFLPETGQIWEPLQCYLTQQESIGNNNRHSHFEQWSILMQGFYLKVTFFKLQCKILFHFHIHFNSTIKIWISRVNVMSFRLTLATITKGMTFFMYFFSSGILAIVPAIALLSSKPVLSYKLATTINLFEPSHEIMVLFILRKLILQTRMRSHPARARCLIFTRTFCLLHVCEQLRLWRDCANVQARLSLPCSPMW